LSKDESGITVIFLRITVNNSGKTGFFLPILPNLPEKEDYSPLRTFLTILDGFINFKPVLP